MDDSSLVLAEDDFPAVARCTESGLWEMGATRLECRFDPAAAAAGEGQIKGGCFVVEEVFFLAVQNVSRLLSLYSLEALLFLDFLLPL